MLNKLSENVFYMPHVQETDRPSLGLVSGDTYSVMIDAGNSPAHAEDFLRAIEKVNLPPVKYVLITHWHWDHVFGIQTIDLPTISHEETKQQIDYMKTLDWDDTSLDQRVASGEEIAFCRDMIKREMPNRDHLELASPSITFDHRLSLDLGGKTCVIEHVGGVHAGDSSIVYIPEDKILFLADCMYEDFYSGDYSYNLEALVTLLDKIKSYDVETYVLGHQPPHSYEEMNRFFDDLVGIGNIVVETTHLKQAVEKFKEVRKETPSEEQMTHIIHFLNGNLKK